MATAQVLSQWHSGEDLVLPLSSQSDGVTVRDGNIGENGNLLCARANGPGMRCQRCGKFTSMFKHVRLKITISRCSNLDGPLLSQEGHNLPQEWSLVRVSYYSDKHQPFLQVSTNPPFIRRSQPI